MVELLRLNAPAEPAKPALPKAIAKTPDPVFIHQSIRATPLQQHDVFVPKETLYAGSTGNAVSQLQMALTQVGALTLEQAAAEVGTLGPQTRAALHDFQDAHQVPGTLLYGPQTRAALENALRAQRFPEVPAADLTRGSRGPDVELLQLGLVAAGRMSGAAAQAEYGRYGDRTEAAIRAFQSELTLMETGSYGPQVRAALSTLLAKQADPTATLKLPAPALCTEVPEASYGLYPMEGTLLGDTPVSPADVFQREAGDCYFDSAIGVTAAVDPKRLLQMMKPNGDGTVTFTFQRYNAFKQGYEPARVTVDANLYAFEGTHRKTGLPFLELLYDSDKLGVEDAGQRVKLFMPLIEKAFAQFMGGSYDLIGRGGFSSRVFESVYGRQGYSAFFEYMKPEEIWSMVQKGVATGTPMTAGTAHAPDNDPAFLQAGLVPGHAYMVLGARQDASGARFVEVRNPWGVRDGQDSNPADAQFEVPFDTFAKMFDRIESCPPEGVSIGNTDDNSWMP